MKNRIFQNLFLGFLVGFFLALGLNLIQKKFEDFLFAKVAQPFENLVFVNTKAKSKKNPPPLEAKAILSIKIDPQKREKILLAKNENEILPIASLSKLMTALIAMENYSLDEKIEISKKAVEQDLVPNYGNLKVGETFTVQKLLQLSLVYSSNHAAYALAEKMGIENFVALMNEKAREIGMKNTIFLNPTGLTAENALNLSTAKDLFLLTKYILENKPEVFEISKSLGPYLPRDSIFDVELKKGRLIGGKTGYLPEIGGCIIFVFENEAGSKIINIILGTKDSRERVAQMQKLVDWINE